MPAATPISLHFISANCFSPALNAYNDAPNSPMGIAARPNGAAAIPMGIAAKDNAPSVTAALPISPHFTSANCFKAVPVKYNAPLKIPNATPAAAKPTLAIINGTNAAFAAATTTARPAIATPALAKLSQSTLLNCFTAAPNTHNAPLKAARPIAPTII